MKLTLPPLRERKEDIPLLVEHFLALHGRGQDVSISAEGLKSLSRYSFPGNVRELSHMIERGIILAQGRQIELRDLLIPLRNPFETDEEDKLLPLYELEKRHIARVLASCQGNKTQAAKVLGISVRNLYRKLEEHKISE